MKYRHPPEGRSTKLGPLINMQQKVASLLEAVGKRCFANCLRGRCSALGRREQGAAPIAPGFIPGVGTCCHTAFLGEPVAVIPPQLFHPRSCPGKGEPRAVLAGSLRHRDFLVLVLGVTGGVCFRMTQIPFGLFWQDEAEVFSLVCPTPMLLLAPRLPPWFFGT